MEKHLSRMAGLFVVSIILFSAFATAADESYKAVVQVIGYENLYGNTPRMIGWGSASMIDSDGHLLTNNHVVDNGFGGTLDGFVVCVTTSINTRPDCTYTASLVARDVEKDIALLRLDSTDIFGQSVNTNNFATIPLDYEYVPTSQDPVVAIGYPWVGADTITQTVGVVAGTQEYNDATYVKTDALIAGGNSGGPLVRDGKVIGVNTFGIGYGESLGYALSIKDAQSFIQAHIAASTVPGFDLASFHTYLQKISTANSDALVDDGFFQIDLSDGYRLTEYEPERLVVSYQMLPDQTSIQAFMMQRFRTPTLDTPEKLKYYLEQFGLYYAGGEKMKEVTIGGIPMYDIFDKSDPSEGLSYGYKKYIAQLNDHEILFMSIQTPTYDESLFQKAKEKLDDFLQTIQFTPTQVFTPVETIDFNDPKISLTASEENDTPLNRGGRTDGSLRSMRYSAGVLRNFLGSLHETISVNIYPQTRDLGRGVSIEELMRTKTQDLRTDDKALISIHGNQGFYACQPDGAYMSTVQGNSVQGDLCFAMIVIAGEGDALPYIVEVLLLTEKKHALAYKKLFFEYLQNGIALPVAGDGKTFIGQKAVTDVIFSDLTDQHPHFVTVLDQLVKYKVLIANRPRFEGNMPMTRGDVLKVYLKGVMGVNMDAAAESCGYPVKYSCLFATQKIMIGGESHPISQLIDDLQIDISAYAASELLYRFDLVMKLALAGVKDIPFTQRGLSTFEELGDQLYPTAKQRVQDREFALFGKRRVPLDEAMPTGYWRTPYTVYRHPTMGIVSGVGSSMDQISFGKNFPRYSDIVQQALVGYCGSDVRCLYREQDRGYGVVTLGELVNYVFPLMDRSIFIPELLEKKEGGGYYY